MIWTNRLVELALLGERDRAGADKKVFIRGVSHRCSVVHDQTLWKATIAGPEEADVPVIVCPIVPATDWIEFPAGSGEAYHITSRRVASHGCQHLVFLGLTKLIGAEVRDA